MIALQFRAETLLWLVIDIVPFITMIFIWKAIYAGSTELSGYSLNQVMQYYFVIALIDRLTYVHFEPYRTEQIREGKIDFYLVRPISYNKEMLISHLSSKIFSIVLFAPVIFFFLIALNALIPDFTFAFQASSLPAFAFLFAASFAIQFMIGLLIVYATFWLEGSQGLEHFKWIGVAMLSGTLMPIAFLPDWLSGLILALPLKYLYAVPISLIDGSYIMQLSDYLYASGFMAAMWLLCNYVWKSAQKQYASAGG